MFARWRLCSQDVNGGEGWTLICCRSRIKQVAVMTVTGRVFVVTAAEAALDAAFSARLKACPDTDQANKKAPHFAAPFACGVEGYLVSANPGFAPNSRRAFTVFTARAAAGWADVAP